MCKQKSVGGDPESIACVYAQVLPDPYANHDAMYGDLRRTVGVHALPSIMHKFWLTVDLSAEDTSGKRIDSEGGFTISCTKHSKRPVWSRFHGPLTPADNPQRLEFERTNRLGTFEIEDNINEMLGRDPRQHRPAHLAWDGLLRACRKASIYITENDLISARLCIQIEPNITHYFGQP